MLKAFFVLKIFKFLSCCFGHEEKRPGMTPRAKFKIYDATGWAVNNYNTNLKSQEGKTINNENWSINRI